VHVKRRKKRSIKLYRVVKRLKQKLGIGQRGTPFQLNLAVCSMMLA
jgi:hypothetical protein